MAREVHPLKTWVYLRGFTYRDLARQSGVSNSTLHHVRVGGRPNAKTAMRIARALRVYPEQIPEFLEAAGVDAKPKPRR